MVNEGGFTPGPWHVVGRAEEFNLTVCAERPGNAARLDSVLGDANAEANALLIAAAPDLYEAVQAFVAAGDMSVFSESSGEALATAHDKALAAIAKATPNLGARSHRMGG